MDKHSEFVILEIYDSQNLTSLNLKSTLKLFADDNSTIRYDT